MSVIFEGMSDWLACALIVGHLAPAARVLFIYFDLQGRTLKLSSLQIGTPLLTKTNGRLGTCILKLRAKFRYCPKSAARCPCLKGTM